MMCYDVRSNLDAFIDGALDTADYDAVMAHLAACAACQAAFEQQQSIEERLRTVFQDVTVPDTLWPRIQADIEREMQEAATPPVSRRRGAWVWPSVAAAVVILALGMTLLKPILSSAPDQARLLSVPVQDLHTFVVSERGLDVASPKAEVVRQWFQGKIDFALPRAPLRLGNGKLIGGRLCHFLNRRVASYMYLASGRYFSLFIMPRQGLDPPIAPPLRVELVQATIHEVQGYTHILWSQTDLLYSLVSDLPQDQLFDMVKMLSTAGKHHL